MKFSLWLLFFVLSRVVNADNTVMEVIPLHNRPASELLPLLAPLLEGTDRAVDDGSSLIVKTTPARLESIRSLIQNIDIPHNNLIVTVFQNSYKTAAELNAEAATAASLPDIQMHGMNADTRDVDSNRNLLTLRTMDGQPAHIQTGKIKLIQDVGVYGSMNGNPVAGGQTGIGGNTGIGNNSMASINTRMIETGTGFAVTPRLNGEQVIIDIEPWSEHFQRNGNIQTQGARSTLRANLGEWVEIAGNDSGNIQTNSGFNTFNHSTAIKTNLRTLIKVDKAD